MTEAEQPGAGRILVGIDGSVGSRIALDWAIGEAARRGSVLHVVHAWRFPSALGAYALLAGAAEVEERSKRLVEEAARTARRTVAEVRADLVPGAAGKVLTDFSTGADLLVVGSRGLGGFTGLLIGSVSQHCVAKARCPTVVVHGADAGHGRAQPGEEVAERSPADETGAEDRGDFGGTMERGDERLDAMRSQLEAASRDFVAVAVRFASEWIPRQVAHVVETNPVHSTELGTGGLGILKAEMRELVARLPVQTEGAMRSSVNWPHLLARISDLPAPWEGWHEVDQLVHRPPEQLTEALDSVVGQARSLLLRHGYARGQDGGDVYVPNYDSQVNWSPELIDASNTYCRLYRSFYDLAHESAQELDAAARAEARQLWAEA